MTNNEALKDPQLNVVPQYQWLPKYGLTVSDLAATLGVVFESDTVTSTWLGDQEVDIRLILDKNYRALETLNIARIHTPDGKHVPLSHLATVENIEAPRLIKHYDGEREVTVTAQISDDSVSPVELSNQLLTQLDGQYARNISIDVGGAAECCLLFQLCTHCFLRETNFRFGEGIYLVQIF